MDPTTLAAPTDDTERHMPLRRVSPEPQDGYVLDPWSGLYQETEATYRHRIQTTSALPA